MATKDAEHPVLFALDRRLPVAILPPEPFRITHSVIGTGVSGVIMSAEYGDTECAAKPVRVSQIPKDEKEVDTLISEFSKLYSLKHSHIVEFIGLCIPSVRRASDRTIWMLTKRAEQSLRDFLNAPDSAEWTTQDRLVFLRDLLSGIEYLHKEGVAHLDLKPENILVDTAEEESGVRRRMKPLITDFGLSRFAPSGDTVMSVLVGAGTHFYMPREQAVVGERVTVAADLFTFGLIAIEILTGVHPLVKQFGRDDAQAHAFIVNNGCVTFTLDSVVLEPGQPPLFDPADELARLTSALKRCLSSTAEERPTATHMYRIFDLITGKGRYEPGNYWRLKCEGAHLEKMQLIDEKLRLMSENGVLRADNARLLAENAQVQIEKAQLQYLVKELQMQHDTRQKPSEPSASEETRSTPPRRRAPRTSRLDPSAEVHFDAAQNHLYGRGGCVTDVRKGAELLKQAAEMGHPRAMFEWGMCLSWGLYFVRIDEELGRSFIIKAAEAGDALACACCHHGGWGSFKKDNQLHFQMLQSLSSSDPWVMNELGWAYNAGDGVEKDQQAATACWQRSAEAGHVVGQHRFAIRLYWGDGMKVDGKRAFQLQSLAAEQGYSKAMQQLAHYYEKGVGGPKNRAKAIEYYKLAHALGWDCSADFARLKISV